MSGKLQAKCLKAQEILSEYEGSFIERISSSAVGDRSTFDILLIRSGVFGELTISLEGVRYLSVANSVSVDSAFFDRLTVVHLPASGSPWPEEAEGFVTRFENLPELVWVRLVGPVEIDVVGSMLTVSSAVDLNS
ncbi:hypothetical protein OG223_45475 [Streptomyces sp. NBC_01478]|uniref:hypothetical protein n=1 Tax=Streptomyces sp. NBC_01478 TaxID=2903882 RepID=UPI002E364D54|nr:hypothetical protein [Streptomyces sp. NBC_01478]